MECELVDLTTGECVTESEAIEVVTSTIQADPELEISSLIDSICPRDKEKAYALVEAARRPKTRRKRLPNTERQNWVKLSKLFGTARIPEEVAEVVQMGLNQLTIAGDIGPKNKFQALEFVFADFIAGAKND